MLSSGTKPLIAFALVLGSTLATHAFSPVAFVRDHDRAPDLPSPACDSLQVDSTHRLADRSFAVGVQRYRWNGTAWVFIEPVATLYGDNEYHEKIGVHYVGPTWEANSGGKVVATRIKSCIPDANAIPWLLLQSTSNEGPGLFGAVSFIQRVNTKGGMAPTAPGSAIGVLADVPYTAEYYFYRPRD